MTENVASLPVSDDQETGDIPSAQAQGGPSVPSNQGNQSNQNSQTEETKDVGGVAGQRLASFLERVERLEEEKAALMEDIKEVYAEAKGVGFDVKTMRRIIALRKMDSEKRRESEELLDLYKSAVGMR